MNKKIISKAVVVAGALICTLAVITGCSKKKEQETVYIEEESGTYATLATSKADKFSYNDLTVNKLKMGMTESEVKAVCGEPANYYQNKENTRDVIDEKVYAYNDLSLLFMQDNGSYRLCAAASTSSNDIFARGIKVGESRDRILELFYRDENCLNNNLLTEDEETVIGKYLYGTFTMDQLEERKVSERIQYGVINYNGNESFEKADSYIVEFTCFEPPYKSKYAGYDDDFAQMAFDIDSKGMISGIRWYYYPEVTTK